jgi:glycosyltransferase involved in cell wall biosynthesis
MSPLALPSRYRPLEATQAEAGARDACPAAPGAYTDRLAFDAQPDESRSGRLRIAAVDPERGFGGGEIQVMGLTLDLMLAGHQVELLCDPDGELWRRASIAGVVCRSLRIRNSIDAVAGLRLRAILSRQPYDVVHFHTARAHALAPFAWGRAGALIVTRRMDYVPNRLFARWLYNRVVDGVAAISAGVAQALVRGGVARERITIIPSGVDCGRLAPPGEAIRQRARVALGLEPQDVAVGAIGALVPRKGHRFLVDAIALTRDMDFSQCSAARRPNAGLLRCFIAGAGPLHGELGHQIARHGLERSVKLMGALDDPAVLLAALDIFVMPSLHEGLGVAALEAMAAGLPVIASAVGGLNETVDHGRNGLLVAAGDAAVLAAAIVRLAEDAELRRAMGSQSRKRALENFAMELTAKRTVKLYHECLRAGRST